MRAGGRIISKRLKRFSQEVANDEVQLIACSYRELLTGWKQAEPASLSTYGGDPGEVRNMTGFAELELVCRSREVELLISVKSASAAVNAGAGGICVAYAGDMVPM
jgi:hypothetical protein